MRKTWACILTLTMAVHPTLGESLKLELQFFNNTDHKTHLLRTLDKFWEWHMVIFTIFICLY